jgi:predicted anti-sigma-YlaC factor YlaD
MRDDDRAGSASGAGLSCSPTRELLSAQLDGEVTSHEATLIRQHLANCVKCRYFQADIVKASVALHAGARDTGPDVASVVMGVIRGSSTKRVSAATSTGPPPRRRLTKIRMATPVVALAILTPAYLAGAVGHVHVTPSHPTPCVQLLHAHDGKRS